MEVKKLDREQPAIQVFTEFDALEKGNGFVQKVNCVLCDVDDTHPYKYEAGYQAVQCNRCGLVYVNPRPSILEMKKLYQGQETKIDLGAHLMQRDYKTIQARRNLKDILRHKSSGHLLEIGSAAGYFLNEARAAGFDVHGLDLTRQFCEFSRNVLGLNVHEGILADAPFASKSFDVIYMRNVLSHLAYPVEEFKILRNLLKPGGILVLETGNVAELAAEAAGELELPDHLYHFSEATINTLFAQTGFQPVETNRFALLYTFRPVRSINKVLNHFNGRRKKQTSRIQKNKPLPQELPQSRFLTRLRSAIAQIVRYDLGAILPKSNTRCTLVMIARRP